MAVIANFDAYPEWTDAVKEVEVLSAYVDGRAERVRLRFDSGLVKDDIVLRYRWDDDREVRWSLERGNMLKAMDGSCILRPGGAGSTEVTYHIAVEVGIPLPGMLKRKAEKALIDKALAELRKRAEGPTMSTEG